MSHQPIASAAPADFGPGSSADVWGSQDIGRELAREMADPSVCQAVDYSAYAIRDLAPVAR